MLIGRRDSLLYAKGYGHLTWNRGAPTTRPDSTLWDLASLSKVVATTSAVMLLVERGRVSLDQPVSRYLPRLVGGTKLQVPVRIRLNHSSGLRSYCEFFCRSTPAAPPVAEPLPRPSIPSSNGGWDDQLFGIMMIHVAFQHGVCPFVLSNFMKTLPKELTEAALVDGASVLRIFWQVILPLCRPALAALATLEFTFIYNDFFWALILMFTGNKRPITSALQSLQGQFFSDNNLLAAGAIIIALPTLIVYFVLQRQFIRGLTLGSTKG